ncbi:MAG TPA: DNA repair protein RecO [Candidatus Saccharimonadales bacterium]|nr:DNA repair protein RecO [Candidatus Saccharimonadales bacterium]
MKQLVTTGIILGRTDYGEADRILTLITPDQGKLRLLARGVRRIKSKLAGGIELFSVSTITFAAGRGELGTLVSTRLVQHYDQIAKDLQRTMTGYDLIKLLNKSTEDQPEPEYFTLLKESFEALNDAQIPLPLIQFWFGAQLLKLGGHGPNLQTDEQGKKLVPDQLYDFDLDRMSFVANPLSGRFSANHIKFLRLVFAGNSPKVLTQVQGMGQLLHDCQPLFA